MAREEPDLWQVMEAYKNASPEEREQLRGVLILLGMSPEKVGVLEGALPPPNTFRDKQRTLDDLDRDFGRAVASALDNPQRLQDLRSVYEQEKKKYLNRSCLSAATTFSIPPFRRPLGSEFSWPQRGQMFIALIAITLFKLRRSAMLIEEIIKLLWSFDNVLDFHSINIWSLRDPKKNLHRQHQLGYYSGQDPL